jgi:hypothetical protein
MTLPAMTGDRCVVVQTDHDSGEPVEGGHVVEATCAGFRRNGDVEVTLGHMDEVLRGSWIPIRFDGSDGYNTAGWERSWRLMLPGDLGH